MTVKRSQTRQRHERKSELNFTPKTLTVSHATSVSFKGAGGGRNSSRKRSMTYIVVISRQHHKKLKKEVKSEKK